MHGEEHLSVSLNLFTRCSPGEAVARAARAGFRQVEVLADVPHIWPLAPDERALTSLEDALARHGVRVANVNANTVAGFGSRGFEEPAFEPSFASERPDDQEQRFLCTVAAMDLAVRLGAPSISITSGRPRVPLERALERLEDNLRHLAEHARRRGIRVGIEYEPGLLVENAAELEGLLDRVDSSWLGANLDVSHAWVNREDPVEVVERLGPRITHVHLADIRGRKHLHLVPGEGDIPFDPLLRSLERVGYRGGLTVEIYPYAHEPDEAAARARTYLSALLHAPEAALP